MDWGAHAPPRAVSGTLAGNIERTRTSDAPESATRASLTAPEAGALHKTATLADLYDPLPARFAPRPRRIGSRRGRMLWRRTLPPRPRARGVPFHTLRTYRSAHSRRQTRTRFSQEACTPSHRLHLRIQPHTRTSPSRRGPLLFCHRRATAGSMMMHVETHQARGNTAIRARTPPNCSLKIAGSSRALTMNPVAQKFLCAGSRDIFPELPAERPGMATGKSPQPADKNVCAACDHSGPDGLRPLRFNLFARTR